MPNRRFMVQVSGRSAPTDLEGIDRAKERVELTTSLHVTVRDQAALQGLLRRLHDLGLDLVDVHESGTAGVPTVAGRDYEIRVQGPIGEIVESTLSDYIGPLRLSTRFAFPDAVLMGTVLSRLLERGADLEHAIEQPRTQDMPTAL